MRKKPTFEELARATLVQSNLGPLKLPYVPPNDASFAMAELRQMTNKIMSEEALGRAIQQAVQQAADSMGVAPADIERMMSGVIAHTSNMFQHQQQMHQRGVAASQREARLQHEQIMGVHVGTQAQIARNAALTGQVVESLQAIPGSMSQAMSDVLQAVAGGQHQTHNMIFSGVQAQMQRAPGDRRRPN